VAAKTSDRKRAFQQFLKSPVVPMSRCETCKCDQETVQAIAAFVVAQDAGETVQTFAAFHRFLCDTYGYEWKETALFNHIKHCIRGESVG